MDRNKYVMIFFVSMEIIVNVKNIYKQYFSLRSFWKNPFSGIVRQNRKIKNLYWQEHDCYDPNGVPDKPINIATHIGPPKNISCFSKWFVFISCLEEHTTYSTFIQA